MEDYLLENCTVDMPADYRSDVIGAIRANFIDRYCSGMRARWKRYSALRHTEERALSRNGLTVWRAVSLELIVKSHCRKEDIQIDDTEFEDYVSTIVSNAVSVMLIRYIVTMVMAILFT